MDQIEFRPMNTAIQGNGRAAIVDPASALGGSGGHCGCGQTTDNGENGQIHYRSCDEAKTTAIPAQEIQHTGRVLDVTMTLRSVCPCRHVSVGYLVTELDEQDNEHARGFKAFTVEPHFNARPCDVEVETMRFILPDDARVDGGTNHYSGTRRFIVRAEAHYADTNVSAT